MSTYLEFEEPLKALEEQIAQTKELGESTNVDMSEQLAELEQVLQEKTKEVFSGLTPWQRVQLSRHPDRPYTLAYIDAITNGQFIELHGDRSVKDDKAMVGGLGMIDGKSVMLIGQQKGINTKMRQYRNFGMPNPEGYRKALRLMKLAEKFNKPIITFIDTPGAFPGLEAEERGQGEAIARNIYEMMRLKVPVICIIIGEGASGGALGIGVGDKVVMLENTWYSVISPESCSSILWRSWNFKETAADALKLTSTDMRKNGLVDEVIPEPSNGAHRNPEEMFQVVKSKINSYLTELEKINPDKRVEDRIEKFCQMGVWK
ncbi:MAG: acetyl-CoA carboxylase carboxyltransferase subunit alpha [Flavobacteriales bacterium]